MPTKPISSKKSRQQRGTNRSHIVATAQEQRIGKHSRESALCQSLHPTLAQGSVFSTVIHHIHQGKCLLDVGNKRSTASMINDRRTTRREEHSTAAWHIESVQWQHRQDITFCSNGTTFGQQTHTASTTKATASSRLLLPGSVITTISIRRETELEIISKQHWQRLQCAATSARIWISRLDLTMHRDAGQYHRGAVR